MTYLGPRGHMQICIEFIKNSLIEHGSDRFELTWWISEAFKFFFAIDL